MDERELTHLVRQELDRTIHTISSELDGRLAQTIGHGAISESRSQLFYFRPAVALAVIAALTFTAGSLLSRQALEQSATRAEGPVVLNDFSGNFSRPILVAESRQSSHRAIADIVNLHGNAESISSPSFVTVSPELTRVNRTFSTDSVSRFGISSNSGNSSAEPMGVSSSRADTFSQPIDNSALESMLSRVEGSTERLSLGYQVEDHRNNLYISRESAGAVYKVWPDGRLSPVIEGLSRPRGLAFDRMGNLYILESGTGRVWRIEPVNGELVPQTSKIFAENFGQRDDSKLSDVAISRTDELFVGAATAQGTVVYKISPKQPTPWWKFFCWYRC